MKKKALFVHYRTNERDGVSLEIEKRAAVAKSLGADVFFLTGYDGSNRKNAFVVPEMDMKANVNKFLYENFFSKAIFEEQVMLMLYHTVEHKLYQQFDEIFKNLSPDLVFIHNLFSMPFSLPASTALVNVLDKFQKKTIVVSHDFWFEREPFLKPNFKFIKEIMKSLPPNRPYIVKHQVINSLATKELEERRKIIPEQIGDYWDFSQPQVKIDSFNQNFKEVFGIGENDIIALQATRITYRKAIENAIHFVHQLQKTLQQSAPITIQGKTFTKDSRVILFMSNFVEVDSLEYFKNLKLLAEKLGITTIWAGEKFMPQRETVDGIKTFSFWDAYAFADFVTYPSILEGFGNQFLEACFYKKLPIIYEYPVFEKDIRKEGYEYISLGNEVNRRNGFYFVPQSKIKEAVEETIKTLLNTKKLQQITEKNFKIAQKYHDESLLVQDFKSILQTV